MPHEKVFQNSLLTLSNKTNANKFNHRSTSYRETPIIRKINNTDASNHHDSESKEKHNVKIARKKFDGKKSIKKTLN